MLYALVLIQVANLLVVTTLLLPILCNEQRQDSVDESVVGARRRALAPYSNDTFTTPPKRPPPPSLHRLRVKGQNALAQRVKISKSASGVSVAYKRIRIQPQVDTEYRIPYQFTIEEEVEDGLSARTAPDSKCSEC